MTTAMTATKQQYVDAMDRLLRTSARMYMFLTEATLETFGSEGEMPVRYGLRAFGAWRGSEMRQAHHAMGLPLNMENLIGCWDNASVYLIKDSVDTEGTHKPFDTRFDVTFCPASEAWKEAGFHRWGHVYCDEFHQACAEGYHPDGTVVIPINMMKGDDHCHFRWVMPPNAEELDLGEPTELGLRLAKYYEATNETEGARMALKRCNRILGGRYTTAARVLVEQFGDKGLEVIKRGMRTWGEERGRILREQHIERGLEPSLANLMHFHDLPYTQLWNPEELVNEPNRFVARIAWTPQDEVWQDLQSEELAVVWYEESYAGLVEQYLPGGSATWTKLLSRGDDANVLELRV